MTYLKTHAQKAAPVFITLLSFLIIGCSKDDNEITPENDPEAEIPEEITTPYFLEEGGLLVIEAEQADHSETLWALRNSDNAGNAGLFHSSSGTDVPFDGVLEGYRGNGYLEYTGADSFNKVVDKDITYTFKIETPGTYAMLWRAFENHTYDPETESNIVEKFAGDRNNDAWTKMEGNFEANTAYYRESGGKQYYGAALAELQEYSKLFSTSGDAEPAWGRSLRLEPDSHDFKEAVYVFRSGEVYNLYISGRSNQLAIDRIYLVRILDENGLPTEDGTTFAYGPFRGSVKNGEYEASPLIEN